MISIFVLSEEGLVQVSQPNQKLCEIGSTFNFSIKSISIKEAREILWLVTTECPDYSWLS